MEIVNSKLREYLHAIKDAGPFSYEDIANVSGTPVQTVRNIYTGKTQDPGFATIAKIIISLGGDLNEIIGYEKKKEIEVSSTVSMKETYEMRIADLIKSYEDRIGDIKASSDQRVADIQRCSDQRVADIQRCYDLRLEDLRKFYEQQLAELKASK